MYADNPQHAQFRSRSKPSGWTLPAFISDAPALFGGAVVSLGVMSAIFVNAMWFQPGQHPAPMFTPRTAEVAVQPVAVKPVETVSIAAAQQARTEARPQTQTSKEILTEVQTALAYRGYYSGKLDGVYGSRTRAAIESFQKDNALPTDGKATVRLLTQVLMSASAAPSQVPVPASTPAATQTAAAAQQDRMATSNAPVADGMIARIQAGLRKWGHDEVVVDGHMGQQTATAIQRFQLKFNMKITGEPSMQLLEKLESIGA